MKELQEILTETGISKRTFAYYREMGLIPGPEKRKVIPQKGSITFYADGVVEVIRRIRRLQEEGLSLHQIVAQKRYLYFVREDSMTYVHCEECVWWDEQIAHKGFCKRKSPVFDPSLGATRWPTTRRDDWCGDGKTRIKKED